MELMSKLCSLDVMKRGRKQKYVLINENSILGLIIHRYKFCLEHFVHLMALDLM